MTQQSTNVFIAFVGPLSSRVSAAFKSGVFLVNEAEVMVLEVVPQEETGTGSEAGERPLRPRVEATVVPQSSVSVTECS